MLFKLVLLLALVILTIARPNPSSLKTIASANGSKSSIKSPSQKLAEKNNSPTATIIELPISQGINQAESLSVNNIPQGQDPDSSLQYSSHLVPNKVVKDTPVVKENSNKILDSLPSRSVSNVEHETGNVKLTETAPSIVTENLSVVNSPVVNSPVVNSPIVNSPVVNSPVVQPSLNVPVVQPSLNVPVVQPSLNVPVVQPSLNVPVVNSPVVNPPVVQPSLNVPEVEPSINVPVVQPKPVISEVVQPASAPVAEFLNSPVNKLQKAVNHHENKVENNVVVPETVVSLYPVSPLQNKVIEEKSNHPGEQVSVVSSVSKTSVPAILDSVPEVGSQVSNVKTEVIYERNKVNQPVVSESVVSNNVEEVVPESAEAIRPVNAIPVASPVLPPITSPLVSSVVSNSVPSFDLVSSEKEHSESQRRSHSHS